MTWTFSKDRHQHARNNFSSLTNRMRVIAPRSITSNYVVTHDGQASRKLERETVGTSQEDLHYASSNGTTNDPSMPTTHQS